MRQGKHAALSVMPAVLTSRIAGRYLPEYHEAKGKRDFFECCRTPEIASTLTIQPVDRYAGLIDAAIIFSDILVIPQAMGMTVEMVDKLGPRFPDPLKSPTDGQFQKLLDTAVDVSKELGYVYEAITLTRKKLQGRVPLIGFCGAPWTLLCYMVEGGGTKLFVESKTWIYKYPEESKALLQKLAEVCVDHLAHQVQAGAQMLQVFDSWAGELSPSSFRKFSAPYLAYIAKRLPEKLHEMGLDPVPIIAFPKGAWYALEDCAKMGYNVVSLDWLHEPAEAVRRRGNLHVVLQGNADPGVLYGSKQSITEVVQEMVDGFGWHDLQKGWIVNLGHGKQLPDPTSMLQIERCLADNRPGITPFVKPDDLKFFFEEIHRLTRLS
jgi:uroporphyrinogen decarboxylase